MAETECVARKWGSSLGIIIPKDIVEKEHIFENETLLVNIQKRHHAKEFFGILAGWKTPTDELKKEMKKGWE